MHGLFGTACQVLCVCVVFRKVWMLTLMVIQCRLHVLVQQNKWKGYAR